MIRLLLLLVFFFFSLSCSRERERRNKEWSFMQRRKTLALRGGPHRLSATVTWWTPPVHIRKPTTAVGWSNLAHICQPGKFSKSQNKTIKQRYSFKVPRFASHVLSTVVYADLFIKLENDTCAIRQSMFGATDGYIHNQSHFLCAIDFNMFFLFCLLSNFTELNT